jgi:hypothetical protein
VQNHHKMRLIILLLYIYVLQCDGSSYYSRLLDDLFSDYDRRVRPVDGVSNITVVKIGSYLDRIIDVVCVCVCVCVCVYNTNCRMKPTNGC